MPRMSLYVTAKIKHVHVTDVPQLWDTWLPIASVVDRKMPAEANACPQERWM